MKPSKYHSFSHDVAHIPLPEKFTFPFYYQPHALAIEAAQELQAYLTHTTDFDHAFGLQTKEEKPIGKMFGVLVVQRKEGDLGYLAAFSGKLANANHHDFFVPPVFDMLQKDGFFKQQEKILNQLNEAIDALTNEPSLKKHKQQLAAYKFAAEKDIQYQKNKMQADKQQRNAIREEMKKVLNQEEYQALQLKLDNESKHESILLKKMKKYWNYKMAEAQESIAALERPIHLLQQERKKKSASLQQALFREYVFLNAQQEHRSLGEIFENNPPAGAGECAAPKLLQYAYKHGLQPVCMAEFWWGASPPSEVRKHRSYYPACRSKCEPILGHMLQGLAVDDNPLQQLETSNVQLSILFEDDYFAAVLKPAEFLSVPGKTHQDSVLSRAKKMFPYAQGPLLVHRLDMSTSGILMIAKTEKAHKKLQALFMQRKVHKRYVAILDGIIAENEGRIVLPLRVDLDQRPQQLVCYTYGKNSETYWKKIDVQDGKTRVHFFPITGRTHQLRVHAAHQLGLHTPIVGDDLYGKQDERLFLHAEEISFIHPFTQKQIKVISPAEF